jgi:hypothetical protein
MPLDSLAPTLGATLLLGFALGLKHATEPDHVLAVSTMVTHHRHVWKSTLVGACWGLGHTAALIVAGTVLLLLRARMPTGLGLWLEMAVAAMIVLLGTRVVLGVLGQRTVHLHAHEHGGFRHIHLHAHERGHEGEHVHAHRLPPWHLQAVSVGVVHGLAGSGGLTLLVMQQFHTLAGALVYVGVFGLGTIVGMLLLSGVISLPLVAAAGRYGRLHRLLCGLAGTGSIVFGVLHGFSVYHSGGAL